MPPIQKDNQLYQILSNLKVKDLPTIQKQIVMEFGKDDLIRDVHEALISKAVLSAPVFDFEEQKYIGIVDLRDIAAFSLSLHKTEGPIIFTAEKIVDFSGMNKFHPISGELSILEALETFIQFGLHRLPVMESPNKVVKMVSQTDIVQWLAQNKEILGTQVEKTVGELQMDLGGISGIKDLLLYIKESEPTEKAFEMMRTYNVHGIPVLNDDGKIVGNISVGDMRHITKWELGALKLTAKEFFVSLNTDRIPLVTCTTSSKFYEMICHLAKAKVHRVYVVDKDDKPVDIITLTNILDTVLTLATGKKY